MMKMMSIRGAIPSLYLAVYANITHLPGWQPVQFSLHSTLIMTVITTGRGQIECMPCTGAVL